MSSSFMARARKQGAHIELQIFVGEQPGDRSLAGTLRFRPEEYKDFIFRILGARGVQEIDNWEGAWAASELGTSAEDLLPQIQTGPSDIPIPDEKSSYQGLLSGEDAE